MQKFTIFTIILSLSILMVLGDLVMHDYLKDSVVSLPTEVPAENQTLLPEEDVSSEAAVNDDDVLVQRDVPVDGSADATLLPEEIVSSGPTLSATELDPLLTAGFEAPALKDAAFSGLIFDFLPFDDALDAQTDYWNLFNGEDFEGSITQITHATQTGAFQGYLALRDSAKGQADLGSINEVNNYGDASFYFNHTIKTKTVHIVVRKGNKIYAFQYAYKVHEKMKKLFDLI